MVAGGEIITFSVPAPEPGESYTYLGKQSGLSWDYLITNRALGLSFGGLTKNELSSIFGLGSSSASYLLSGYEPTKYAKIYGKIVEGNAYIATFKTKYVWFEDSKFNTYKTTTTRSKRKTCSDYTPYCWR
ncbi:hypothetical protein [Sediminibacillus halophilus]|uniref:Uncharacterized protein n=1 Tax=Sediminibacillus halophilus TaxID=482461 RepID=A0A1G9UZP6_9BACI|nr:hypothetical protein [Sediminibacillus halophilus]SDM65125.1 hypothetical protein SAMN05216244_3056 [Sediminibacillus halophilus]